MGYIFEAEIERMMHTVRARTIGESDSITLREILASSIHPAIKAYFTAEVERQLEEERQLEVRSKKFPYSVPEVASLQRQMDLLLIYQYEFDQQEFDTLLDQAIHFTFNFLCRPQFTLVEFLFENQRQQSTVKIEQKLKYCVDYEYYSVLLKRYFADHGLASISYEEFRQLLAKIDDEVVSRHTSRELANMTRAIMAFVKLAQDPVPNRESSEALPINAAIVFYEDKHLDDIKLRLEYERDHAHVTEIDIPRLSGIVEEVRTIASGGQLEPAEESLASAPQAELDAGAVPVAIARSEGHDPSPVAVAEPVAVLERAEVHSPPAQREDNPAPTPSVPAPGDVPPDIRSLLSSSEAKKIIKSVFHKDEEEFQSTLGLLNGADTWEEASLILDDLFLAKDIAPQSRVAIILTEKVFQRFHPAAE